MDEESPHIEYDIDMSTSQDNWTRVADDLLKLPREVEWVEFKQSKADPTEIGEYLSALSNSAALAGKTAGYMLWGIDDTTRKPVGCAFRPFAAKGAGNEDLHNWLTRLSPSSVLFCRTLAVRPAGGAARNSSRRVEPGLVPGSRVHSRGGQQEKAQGPAGGNSGVPSTKHLLSRGWQLRT
jgi:Putative DNA-binding domain